MSDMGPLQRMLNRTTLSTQRLLHTHILGLGEYFLSPSTSTSTSTSQDPGPASFSPHSEQLEVGATQGESPWMAVFLQRAEEDKERSLKQQEECLQVCFKEALLARERLEAEQRQGERVEQQAQFEERCVGLREEIEREMRLAVEETCGRMRAAIQREVEEERQREVEAKEEKVQENVKRLVRETEVCVRQQCEREAQKDLQTLQDRHTVELALMQSRYRQLEQGLARVTGERMSYETEFKRLQCSYRQFVDLTESSLHSDYLLKLRRLGREPGYTDVAVQTDDVTNTHFT
ncbi:inner centromere protein [Salmo salar]|uniref:Inner centromere protein-like n=1 Tax=Salmo salar TaxID=8030 RepID=A0A1S3N8C5_SALSA|nr:inner centromere protein [Salmo salar]XP_014011552.1 inner centromere protein [Salmo salar]|eukprot:XP_014011550.1 PREDICTED: inner centromere protein-like [Salmo salar]